MFRSSFDETPVLRARAPHVASGWSVVYDRTRFAANGRAVTFAQLIDLKRVHIIAAYAATQHATFSGFLLDYARDLKDDAEARHRAIAEVRNDKQIVAFLQSLHAIEAPDNTRGPISAALENLLASAPPAGTEELLTLLEANIFHRTRWDAVIAANPLTLEVLGRSARL